MYYFHIFKVETFHPSGGREVVKLLIGNKIDLEDRAVSRNEGEEWARSKVWSPSINYPYLCVVLM